MGNQQQVTFAPNAFVSAYGKTWDFDHSHIQHILLCSGEKIFFSQAKKLIKSPFQTGLGLGESTQYSEFEGYGTLAFETRVLINNTTGYVDCSFIPLNMAELKVKEVCWPQPLTADEPGSYAVLNTMQGQLLPTDWPEIIGEKLPFNGQMGSESAYMPWWGEVSPEGGYLCYVRQSWDSAYTIDHPAGGPTRVFIRHLPSLGQMRYARTVTFCFVPAGKNYVDLCKLYRSIADEEGRPRTLKEKAAANPNVQKLVGCCVMHVEGKSHVTEKSAYYNHEEPEKNDRLVPFSHWIERVKELKLKGVKQLYLHLDGWGQPGYDNQHPDYLPPCKEAGGWEGMKELSDTLDNLGYMFGIHDQYRDYYLDAPTYDVDNAAMSADGSIYEFSRWAGGTQNYLCASLAPDYVRRNFEQLFDYGIHLEGTYLDVFTCNELDECINSHHPMTRRECIDYRNQCFHYLTAHHVAPSSEEVNDWAMGALAFCHWAPYYSSTAIATPLYNLVYHDCVMIPWVMGGDQWGIPEGTIGFLHALLNGGMGYMDEKAQGVDLEKNIIQWKELSKLAHHVALEKMVNHEFLCDDYTIQRSTFSGGTQVTVNFKENTYSISYPEKA